jgi:hypothetical protein
MLPPSSRFKPRQFAAQLKSCGFRGWTATSFKSQQTGIGVILGVLVLALVFIRTLAITLAPG